MPEGEKSVLVARRAATCRPPGIQVPTEALWGRASLDRWCGGSWGGGWQEGGRYTVQHRLTMCHDERLCGGDTRGNAAARHGDAVHTARERETLTKWQARHPSYCCFRNRLPFKRATCSCKASPGLLSCSNIPEGAVGVGGVPQAWKLRGQPGLRAVPGGHAWLPLAVPGSPADSGGGVPLLDTDLSGRLVPIYTRTCHHLISPSTNLMAGACPGFSVMVKN